WVEQWRTAEAGGASEQRPGPEPHCLWRCGAGRHALPVVEVEQHRRALRRRDQQVRESAQGMRPDRRLDVRRRQKPVGALRQEDVEVIDTEVDHYLVPVALRTGY